MQVSLFRYFISINDQTALILTKLQNALLIYIVSNASVLDNCACNAAFAEIHGCFKSLYLLNFAPRTDNDWFNISITKKCFYSKIVAVKN